jgi:hypothetical protein
MLMRLVAIPVLKVEMVERRLAFNVELLFPFSVEREDNPIWVATKFVVIRVLKVDMVENN